MQDKSRPLPPLRFKPLALPEFQAMARRSLWSKALLTLRRGQAALARAVRENDIVMVERMMRAGADPHRCGDELLSPLEYAAMEDCNRALEFMLAMGADPNHVSKKAPYACPVLVRACRQPYLGVGKIKAASLLLAAGADPDKADGQGRRALHEAIEHREGESLMVKILLAKGASPDGRTMEGHSPLLLAAEERNWHAMAALLDAGADVDLADNDGRTPLMASCASGGYGPSLGIDACVQLLLDRGADVGRVDKLGSNCVKYALTASNRPALAGELQAIVHASEERAAMEGMLGSAPVGQASGPLRM